MLIAAVLGIVTGLLYTKVTMWLLGSLWKGATHTDGFSMYPNSSTIIGGFAAGILLSLFILYRTITKQLKKQQSKIQHSAKALNIKKFLFL